MWGLGLEGVRFVLCGAMVQGGRVHECRVMGEGLKGLAFSGKGFMALGHMFSWILWSASFQGICASHDIGHS